MKSDRFWKDKKVLVIGHTSLIGSWLCIWLKELGADIIGFGPEACLDKDNYNLCKLEKKIIDINGDIIDKESIKKVFEEYHPEIVIDLKSFNIKENNNNSIETYQKNIVGTLNILECIKDTESVKSVIIGISHKCYEVKEQMWGYKENDNLGGKEPFSASMASISFIIDSYRETYLNPKDILSHNKSLASVRIGEVIGGGEWEEDKIIPACATAFSNKDSVVIKSPETIKPWQHVLEPIRGILILAQKMYENPGCYCENWNLGAEYDSCTTVIEAVTKFQKEFRKGDILELDEEDNSLGKGTAVLDITKAKYRLGWVPKWTIEKALSYTADWYKNYKTKDVYSICRNHIEKYSLL